nr:hypothetical protein [Tanacetum cinerariifolium]
MADLAFAPQHNMVPYLEKTEANAEFHHIVDFFTSSSIHHALTMLSSDIAKTPSKATLNEPNPHEEGSGSGLGCQETIGGTMDQIRPEDAPIQSNDLPLLTGNTIRGEEDKMEHAIELTDLVPQTPHDSPLSGGHTPGNNEGSMTLKELTDLCTTLSRKVLDLEKVKTAQAKEIASFKKRVTMIGQRQSLRISCFHPFRAGTSGRHSLGRRNVSKQGRKNLKSQQKFQDIDDLVDEDKGSGEKRGSTAETVSTTRPDISAARPEVSTAEPKTPLTTTLFDDEDVTIADTLVKIKSQKAKEKGVAFKDADDSARPIRSITTLQPLPTIDPNDKDLDEEVKTERERQEEASKAALAKLYDEVSKKMKRELEAERKEQQALGTIEAGDVHVYKLTRLDGSYRHFSTFSRMLEVLDRQDVLDLHKIVMERFPANDPEVYTGPPSAAINFRCRKQGRHEESWSKRVAA